MAGPTSQARPMGITILAILSAIGGVFGLLAGVTVVFGGAIISTVSTSVGGLVTLLGLVLLALSVAELVLAYGFWMLQKWAWQLGVFLEAGSVVLSVLQLVIGGGGFFNVIWSVAIAGIVLYYLNMPEIRTAFNAPATGWPVVGDVSGMRPK